MLGTVALGMEYGISNRAGKPEKATSFDVLTSAVEYGINWLDTARTYGCAEELIAEYVELRGLSEALHVVTKFKISPRHIYDLGSARTEALASVGESRRRLRKDVLEICLFHMDRDLPLAEVMKVLPVVAHELREEGLIATAGISIDDASELDAFAGLEPFEIFQVPVNIFDQRLIEGGAIKRCHDAGKAVVARSVFLQGLFFLEGRGLKGNLRQADGYLRELRLLAELEGMSVPQLAFSYIRDLQGISSIVFGAENAGQVKENIALLKGDRISEDTRELIGRKFRGMPEEIITPRFWNV
jgi:aryl-alcohol dehydrogenase-like predicted oxidoreductase